MRTSRPTSGAGTRIIFTERMLVDYAAAVGLRPWEDSFYRPPFHLITSLRLGRDRFQRTLAQVRTEMKLDE